MPIPTITSALQPTSRPTLSPTAFWSTSFSTLSLTVFRYSSSLTSTPTSTPQTNSNRGGMEGGFIGGIVGVTLISGVVTWFIVRRRRARCAPSITDTRGEMEQPTPYPLTIESPRLYVSLYSLSLYRKQVWNESCN